MTGVPVMDYLFLRDVQVYRELVLSHMLEARRSLWIATANLKDMHVEHRSGYRSVLRAFREMVERGVDVRILHAGIPGERYRRSLKDAGLIGVRDFTMRRCVRVHFKCVLVDDDWVFLGSPNLTGAGMGAKSENRRNFEAGVLTRDGALRRHVRTLFLDVWDGRMCETCGRKRSCPVPLEEPDF
ncbi:MAG TPA: phospholipase D-like domain-containing protein [Planctomycetota bacterium]|nr:phospholipase D-like domain-containing protein [Planctomycetota bacterium]